MSGKLLWLLVAWAALLATAQAAPQTVVLGEDEDLANDERAVPLDAVVMRAGDNSTGQVPPAVTGNPPSAAAPAPGPSVGQTKQPNARSSTLKGDKPEATDWVMLAIIIVVAVVAILALALIAWWIIRRRKRKTMVVTGAAPVTLADGQPAELVQMTPLTDSTSAGAPA